MGDICTGTIIPAIGASGFVVVATTAGSDSAAIAASFGDELLFLTLLGFHLLKLDSHVSKRLEGQEEVCFNQNLELNTRHQAIQKISWLAKYKSKSLKKYRLVDHVLHIMCPSLAESSNRDDDGDLAQLHLIELLQKVVRGASFALGQFAEYLQPEIVSHYESVLPCILSALEDASGEVKEKSYYALAAFCENMGEEILSFLDPLMAKLLGALHSSPKK